MRGDSVTLLQAFERPDSSKAAAQTPEQVPFLRAVSGSALPRQPGQITFFCFHTSDFVLCMMATHRGPYVCVCVCKDRLTWEAAQAEHIATP